jgi:two-component system cell cycle sensor histidine kinase/response regulator CckA
VSENHLERILVVETDSDVQALISRILEAPGRRILIATHETQALHLASSNQIDLLLTEVVLPGGGGIALATQLQSLQPGLRVVYMSGWHDHPSFPRPAGAPVLEKPSSSEELRHAITQAMEERGEV